MATADRIAPSSSGSQSSTSGPGLALRFISGKYQGGEFVLENDRDFFVGRSSDVEMVLVEEMVSRKHAKISVRGGVVTIEDLGSTNGTFVNGEKIDRVRLNEGDRLVIGTSILNVVSTNTSQVAPIQVPGRAASGAKEGAPPTASAASSAISGLRSSQTNPSLEQVNPPAPPSVNSARSTLRSSEDGPRMSGALAEVPLPDLLQLFGASRKSGVLVVRTEHNAGQIYLKQGVVHFANLESSPELPPLKAISRMISWEQGLFQLNPAEERVFEPALDLPVQEILMEAFRQQDEFGVLSKRLPSLAATIQLASPLAPKLSQLGAQELDVLQVALNAPDIGTALDRSELSDLETGQLLLKLIEGGYLVVAK